MDPRDDRCFCLTEGPRYGARREEVLGIDPTGGTFAEIAVWTCTNCRRYWLRALIENEWHSGSGRWYMGLMSPVAALTLRPERGLATIEGLDWYLCGGSYFGGQIQRRTGPLLPYP